MKLFSRRVQTRLVLLLGFVFGGTWWLGGQTVSTQTRSGLRDVIDGHEVAAGEVLLKFRRQLPAAEQQALQRQLDVDENAEIGRDLGVFRLHSRSFNTESLLGFLRTHPSVEYVEPNYVVHTDAIPNDPMFGNLWGLLNTGQKAITSHNGTPGADIHATGAWDVSTGSTANVVAIIDTGIDYNHPDLHANVWSAPASFQVTIGGTTITCAAGTHGFNVITKTCDPLDDNNHGSHVSGTIGAVGNNGVGVVGVNWTASIMGSKFLDATGSGLLSDAVNAIEFVIQAKAAFGGAAGAANVRVLNNSWAGGGYFQPLLDEINKANANDMLFVAAAGNSGLSNDVWESYPADYTFWGAQNIIAVAATDNNDQLASFSNYGPTLVHLGAPGVNIRSTTIGNTYQYFSGTSMATPHVSGAAALVLSACTLDTAALKNNLLNNVDVVAGLTGWVSTNGRLNVDKAIRACHVPPPAPPGNVTAAAGNAKVTLSWSPSAGATSYNVKRGTASGSETQLANVSAAGYADMTTANGTQYFYVITAVNAGGQSLPSAEVSATPSAPVPPTPSGLTATAGNAVVSLSWSPSAGATSYNVKRGTASGSETQLVNVSATGYTDTAAANGTTYFYVVTAVNASGESLPSAEASATPSAPVIPPPTGLTATAGNANVALTWTAAAGANSYNVYRASGGGSFAKVASGIVATTYADSTAANGVTYSYEVTTVAAGSESLPSNVATATPVGPPPAPTALTAATGSNSGEILLQWNSAPAAKSYNVRRSVSNGGPYAVIAFGVKSTSYVDTGLTSGQQYFYVVSAVNSSGLGPNSAQASAPAK